MDFVTLFISMTYLLTIVELSVGEDCDKKGPCICKTSKYTIDLNPLNTENPRFSSPNGNYLYDYQPCIALNEDCSGLGAAVCQKANDGGAKFNAGSADTVLFNGDADAGTLTMEYSAGERKSIINLVCACVEGQFTALGEKPQNQYNFELRTKYACGSRGPSCPGPSSKGGLSTGSVLLILFFVFLAVYFIAGILFLKFVRGAQGTEMIPNYEFWTALPGLIKDGFLFACRGCKKDSSYSQI